MLIENMFQYEGLMLRENPKKACFWSEIVYLFNLHSVDIHASMDILVIHYNYYLVSSLAVQHLTYIDNRVQLCGWQDIDSYMVIVIAKVAQ